MSLPEMNSLKSAEAIEDYVIGIRRDLHEHPEVSGEEDRTIRLVTAELEKMGLSSEVIKNGGVLSIIKGTHPGKTLVLDRKSTRLNSSHVAISYAVFCLK